MLQRILPRGWAECVVAATGPSLTPGVAERCRGRRVVAVNDAYRLFPDADVLYAADAAWWDVHEGCPEFGGEKWSSHDDDTNNKFECAERWGLNLVAGANRDGFSLDPSRIHYGGNSGFQAINLAILFGAKRIALVGFDMQGSHFFGNHPPGLKNHTKHHRFIPAFQRAAERLPEDIRIVNCTPGSALRCWPSMPIGKALAHV